VAPEPKPVSFELPSPQRPDMAWLLVQSMTPQVARELVARMGEFAVGLAQESPATQGRLRSSHALASPTHPLLQGDELVKGVQQTLDQTRALLEGQAFERYQHEFEQRLETLVLTAPPGTDVVEVLR
jgi:hypothetical protein